MLVGTIRGRAAGARSAPLGVFRWPCGGKSCGSFAIRHLYAANGTQADEASVVVESACLSGLSHSNHRRHRCERGAHVAPNDRLGCSCRILRLLLLTNAALDCFSDFAAVYAAYWPTASDAAF